jgi:hypothetical protein
MDDLSPSIRSAITNRVNSWTTETLSRLKFYEAKDGNSDMVKPWIARLEFVKFDPINNS